MKNLKSQAFTKKYQDYSDYSFNKKERLLFSLEGAGLVGVFAYFFYHSWIAVLFLSPLLFLFLNEKKKEMAAKRRRELGEQFRDAILSVCANQKAGYSVENAFKEAYFDMAMLYGKDSIICKELYSIAKGLDNNVVLEELLADFGERSYLPDIIQFADVFCIAKRSGGNMTEILSETAETISQKMEADEEIEVLLSAGKMEQRIMNAVPILIIAYINVTSKGFFDVLYHNVAGICIMTVCLVVYFASYMLAKKIMNIEV